MTDTKHTRFRKKPVVIEAAQWFKDGDHKRVLAPPRICVKGSDMRCEHCGNPSGKHGEIETLESGNSVQIVCPGDWVITGIKGECYPCKPDIFAATYEPESVESVNNYSSLVSSVKKMGEALKWAEDYLMSQVEWRGAPNRDHDNYPQGIYHCGHCDAEWKPSGCGKEFHNEGCGLEKFRAALSDPLVQKILGEK